MKKLIVSMLIAAMAAWFPIQTGYTAWREDVDIGSVNLTGNTEGTSSVLLRDSNRDILLATGTTVPADASSGYAKGGLFIDTDVATGTRALYENNGTNTSTVFQRVGAVSSVDAIYGADGNLQARVARATYDFAVDGGTHNTDYDLGVTLPDNAVITRAWYDVITTFTSGGTDAALIGIGLPTDDAQGIVAFTSISSSGNVWDAGYHEAIQTGTAANFSEKTTAARAVTFTIQSTAAGDLTAGALVLFLEYAISD